MTTRWLVTGAAGAAGGVLRAGLAGDGITLRLLDIAPLGDPASGEELVVGSILDPELLARAMTDVDAVVHLAGFPRPRPAEDIVTTNIAGTWAVFEAARAAGVGRVVFASSNHATGFTPRPADGGLLGVEAPTRPDTGYGVGKVAGEAIGRLYADRHGMSVASLRIGTLLPRPRTRRHLATWLSPRDLVALVRACLTAPGLQHAVVWGISANTRGWWDLAPGRALGYAPVDDAEAWAAEIPAGPDDERDDAVVGGEFTAAGIP